MPRQVSDYLFRIVMVGDEQVGKSNLLKRFEKNEFEHSHIPTIGVDFARMQKRLGDINVIALIWDMSGQERFNSITSSYYDNAVGAIFIYDISCRKSFKNISNRLKSFTSDSTFMLIGNKLDKAKESRAVTFKEAARLAQENNMLHFEVSALDNIGVEDAFMTLISRIYENASNPKNQEKPRDLVSALTIIEQLVQNKKELEEKIDAYKDKCEKQELEITNLKQQLEIVRLKQQLEQRDNDQMQKIMQMLQLNGVSEKKHKRNISKSKPVNANDNPENDIYYDSEEEMVG